MSRWITPLGCFVLAGVLLWAGVPKLMEPAAFADNIMGFRVVNWPMAAALALYLPWLEAVTALGLIAPRWRPGALLVSNVLFGAFTLLWAVTWARGLDVTCGCFGGDGKTSAAAGFVRALVMWMIAAWIWRRRLRERAPTEAGRC